MDAFELGFHIGVIKFAEEEGGITSVPRQKVINFFNQTPNPDDEQFHDFAERHDYNTEAAEGTAYQLSTLGADLLSEGKSNEEEAPDSYNPDDVAKGMKIEEEHSTIPEAQAKITKDHLAEHPGYYDDDDGLPEMEDRLTEKGASVLKTALDPRITGTVAGAVGGGLLGNLAKPGFEEADYDFVIQTDPNTGRRMKVPVPKEKGLMQSLPSWLTGALAGGGLGLGFGHLVDSESRTPR